MRSSPGRGRASCCRGSSCRSPCWRILAAVVAPSVVSILDRQRAICGCEDTRANHRRHRRLRSMPFTAPRRRRRTTILATCRSFRSSSVPSRIGTAAVTAMMTGARFDGTWIAKRSLCPDVHPCGRIVDANWTHCRRHPGAHGYRSTLHSDSRRGLPSTRPCSIRSSIMGPATR